MVQLDSRPGIKSIYYRESDCNATAYSLSFIQVDFMMKSLTVIADTDMSYHDSQ